MSRPFQLLQQNLLTWFYTAYVHRIGTYLIDVNSGRLRVGARRYQELLKGMTGDSAPPEVDGDMVNQIGQVTIAVVGQVKSGKSREGKGAGKAAKEGKKAKEPKAGKEASR